jgi:uncharacterized membrane protein
VPVERISHSHKSSQAASTSQTLGSLTKKNIEVIAELEAAANAKRSVADKLADVVSGFVGSMAFVYLHIVWFGLWIVVNAFSNRWQFDPYPFTFLTFVVSLEAIFLSTFILISQNHEELLSRRRNHLDLQINLLSEQENSQMLKMLMAIEKRLSINTEKDAEALDEDVQPEKMAAQIERAIEADAEKKDCDKS